MNPERIRETKPYQLVTSTVVDNGFFGTPTAFNLWMYYALMVDTINPIERRLGIRPVGLCAHTQCTYKIKLNTMGYIAGNGHLVEIIGYSNELLKRMHPQDTSSSGGDLNFPGWLHLLDDFTTLPTFQNLCLAAWNKQYTQVPNLTSLINFIIELEDFKGIAKTISKIPASMKGGVVKQSVQNALKRKNFRKLPKKIAGSSVDTFLQFNFAWMPFISDLKTFAGIADSAAKKLDFLVKSRRKTTKIRFLKEDCYQHPKLGQVVHTRDDGPDTYQRVVLSSYKCDFVCTWDLYHNLADLEDSYAGLRVALAQLTLNNPIKIVWNAIPLSFIADWVGPFGSWIERSAVQPFTGQWDISRVSTSYHERYSFDFLFTGKRGGTDGVAFTVTVDRYFRIPGLPFTLGAIEFSQLTNTQQKLALSIPLSKVLK